MNITSPPSQQVGGILIVPSPDQGSIGQTPATTPVMQPNQNIDMGEVVLRLQSSVPNIEQPLPLIVDPEEGVPFAQLKTSGSDAQPKEFRLTPPPLPPQRPRDSSQRVCQTPPSAPLRVDSSPQPKSSSTQEPERQNRCMRIFNCIFSWRKRSKVTPY